MNLTATAVTSSCSFDPNTATVSGTSGIVNGDVSTLGLPIRLASNAAPNTTVTVPGVATITLNRQTTAGDGTLTVDAVYVQLANSAQTLTLGTSVCNAASLAPVPVLPGMALPIGLGALAVLMLGGVATRSPGAAGPLRRPDRIAGDGGPACAGPPSFSCRRLIGAVSADNPAGVR